MPKPASLNLTWKSSIVLMFSSDIKKIPPSLAGYGDKDFSAKNEGNQVYDGLITGSTFCTRFQATAEKQAVSPFEQHVSVAGINVHILIGSNDPRKFCGTRTR